MLGCILYELCTLRKPFEGQSLNVCNHFLTITQNVIHKIIAKPYESLESSLPHYKFDPIFTHLLEMLL